MPTTREIVGFDGTAVKDGTAVEVIRQALED